MSKKFLYILPFALSALFAAGFVFARELEVSYPSFGNIPGPSSTRTLLPDYVKYIFTFSIAISGLVAFGVIFFAGFEYFTSGGNPTKLSDAKNKIIQALIGIVILLGSYLLLTTINPELIIINPITAKGEGVILYTEPNCPGGTNPDNKTNFLKLGVSAGDLENLSQRVSSIWLYKPSSDLEVKLYPQKNWEGEAVLVNSAAGGCVSSPLPQAMSIELNWKNPGVYLCTDATKRKCSVYNTDTPTIPKDFEDKVGYIYFKNPDDGTKYGAVLHEGRDFGRTCDVFFDTKIFNVKQPSNIFPGDGVSSITVFRQTDVVRPEGGITLYESTDYNSGSVRGGETTGEKYGAGEITLPKAGESPVTKNGGTFYEYPDFTKLQFTSGKEPNVNDAVSSLKVKGNYMALLFRNSNYQHACEAFVGDTEDPNIGSGNYIGEDQAGSAKIIPIKK